MSADDDVLINETVSLFGGKQLNIYLIRYCLELATPFGTSHSTSSFRSNALLLFRIPRSCGGNCLNGWELKGCGEVGLPPKKVLVYEADLDDMKNFVASFIDTLQGMNVNKSSTHDAFRNIPTNYFARVRSYESEGKCDLPYRILLEALDICSNASVEYARAGKALIESAIFDSWARDLNVPLYNFLNIPPSSESHRSFYTAALNEDITKIVEAARFGAKYTPHLKIKLNDSLDRSKDILTVLDSALPHVEGNKWSIDANSSWSPEIAVRMLHEVLGPFKKRIYMVEQPFPVDVHLRPQDLDTLQKWKEVKKAYNKCGILIFADESMRTFDDVKALQELVDGVNIKIEKCGGFRGAVIAVEETRQRGLLVWFGCMVGSNINSTLTAHMHSLAISSDLDGALLVKPESQWFEGGFEYVLPHGNIRIPEKAGSGLFPNQTFVEAHINS